MNVKSKFTGLITKVLIAAVLLPPYGYVRAEDSNTSKELDAKRDNGFRAVCEPIIERIRNGDTFKAFERPKVAYCIAAADARKAQKANRVLAPVWGAVSAVCATACVNPLWSGACSYSNMGGSAIDAGYTYTTTKDMNALSQSIAMSAAQFAPKMVNRDSKRDSKNNNKQNAAGTAGAKGVAPGGGGTGNASLDHSLVGKRAIGPEGNPQPPPQIQPQAQPTPPAGSEPPVPKDTGQPPKAVPKDQQPKDPAATKDSGGTDWMACFNAATAGARVVEKSMNATKAGNQSAQNTQTAGDLNDVKMNAPVVAAEGSAATADGRSAVDDFGDGSFKPTDSTLDSMSSDCDSALTTGNTYSALQCAAKADPSMPPFVFTQRFPDEFKQSTGMDLGQFVQKSANSGFSGPQLTGTVLGWGDPGMTAQLTGLYEGIADKLALNEDPGNTGIYSGGGGVSGGNPPGSKKRNSELDKMMLKMMGKLMNGNLDNGDPKLAPSLAEEQEYRRFRGLTGDRLFEARDISIFDRVSYRYYKTRERVETMQWQTRYNSSVSD